MTHYQAGDTSTGLCHRDGRVGVTWRHKDVTFRNSQAVVKGILVGCCDECGDAILIPAQETDKIAAAALALRQG